TDGKVYFASVFSYFRQPYFLRIVGATLLVSVITQLLSFGLGSLGFAGTLLYLILLVIFSTYIVLVHPLIIFGNMNIPQAFRYSYLIVSKKFFSIFGILFVFGLLMGLGALVCGIGLFFTWAFYPISL